MEATQTKIESQAIELSSEAFNAFCEDIGGMFGVDMKCEQQEVATETVKELKKRFKKLVSINSVQAEGALDGVFHLVFDQGGLFATSGVIVMQPEKRILEQIKCGTAKEAEHLDDALGECGNLLVGSWDRVFREGIETHGHFVQTNTYIGEPWDEPRESIGLDSDEELLFISYEMTIDPFPSFHCGVIFPRTLFDDTSAADSEASDQANEISRETPPEEEKAPQATAENTDSKESDAVEKNDSEEAKPQISVDEEVPCDTDKPSEPSIEVDPTLSDEDQTDTEGIVAEKAVEAANKDISEPVMKTDAAEPPAGPVSEMIQKMVQVADGGKDAVFLSICAKDVMQKQVVWGVVEDSVQQTLTKMQQADVGYMLVGTDEGIEGIVSKCDIAGAVSVYLRPVFEKWRRPLDDATLRMKIKWVMTRPVYTIKPDTTLTTIMEQMLRFGVKCLPVVDQQGKVQGLVTAFDVFGTLLNSHPDVSLAGQAAQTPPLSQLDS